MQPTTQTGLPLALPRLAIHFNSLVSCNSRLHQSVAISIAIAWLILVLGQGGSSASIESSRVTVVLTGNDEPLLPEVFGSFGSQPDRAINKHKQSGAKLMWCIAEFAQPFNYTAKMSAKLIIANKH